jgi:hypothetical protein
MSGSGALTSSLHCLIRTLLRSMQCVSSFPMQTPTLLLACIQYLEEHLADDKLPAKYDPWIAHCVCPFINPTWAPGITSGRLEDGLHEDDAKCEKPEEEEVHKVISTLFHEIYCLLFCHPGNHSSHLLASSFCSCEQQGLHPHLAKPINDDKS